VSLLKRSPGSQPVSPSIPSALTEFQVPEKLLQWRWSSGERPIHQVLVKWSHMPVFLATWESVEELRRQFPRSAAWGHVGTQGGGIVSSTLMPPQMMPLRVWQTLALLRRGPRDRRGPTSGCSGPCGKRS